MAKYHYTVKSEGGKLVVRVLTPDNYVAAISIQPSLSTALAYIRKDSLAYHA